MSALLAESYGVAASSPDNTASIQAAINAAAAAHTQVLFPAGDLRFSSPITLPHGFVGSLSIGGMGRKLTRFVPIGNINGFTFDLSAGTAALNSVDLFDLGFVATGAAGQAISITYGTGSLGGLTESVPGSSLRDIAIYGGGWTSGIALTNAWHLDARGLYLYGSAGQYATNGGVGLSLTSCFNCTFDSLTAEFWTKGITLRSLYSVGGDSQGVFLNNVQMVECIEGVHG